MVAPAGYGQFTGYEPAENGGYLFQRGDAPPLMFAGPPAEELKGRIDAYNSVNQPKVAGPGGGGPIDAIGGYGSAMAPPTAEQMQAFREQVAPTVPASATAPAAAPSAQAPTPGGQLGYGMRVSPQGTLQRHQGGSAGVSKQQLEKKNEQGTELRTGVSETVQGAVPADQEYLEARTQMNIDQRLALDKERQTAAEAAESESKLAEQQFQHQQRLMSEEQGRVADLQKKVAADEQLRNKAYADFSSSKVDPERIYSGSGGTAQRAIHAFAAAAGAFGSALAKTPNFALQIINSTVDRDIASQEAAIRIKGESANNALQKLTQSGMSLDQAKVALKGIQINHQRAELEQMKARNAVPALQNQYDKLDLALQNGLLEANEAYRRESIGKTTRTTQSAVAYPQAATAGGWVDVGDQLGTAQKVQNLRKGEVEIAKDQAAATKGPTASPEKRKAMGALAEVARLQKTIGSLPDDGVIQSPEDSDIGTKFVAGVAEGLAGKGAGARLTMSEKERRDLASINAAKEQIKSMRSVLSGQGALDEQGARRADAAIAPGSTNGEIKRALADLYSAAEAANLAADATGEAGGNLVTK